MIAKVLKEYATKKRSYENVLDYGYRKIVNVYALTIKWVKKFLKISSCEMLYSGSKFLKNERWDFLYRYNKA